MLTALTVWLYNNLVAFYSVIGLIADFEAHSIKSVIMVC
jgi:hypothetical protein